MARHSKNRTRIQKNQSGQSSTAKKFPTRKAARAANRAKSKGAPSALKFKSASSAITVKPYGQLSAAKSERQVVAVAPEVSAGDTGSISDHAVPVATGTTAPAQAIAAASPGAAADTLKLARVSKSDDAPTTPPTTPLTNESPRPQTVPARDDSLDLETPAEPRAPEPSVDEEPIDHDFTKPPAEANAGDSPEKPLLFEIGWEVCWQLGGIYTVLKTKAHAMVKKWGDRYCLIGPYNPTSALTEFEERQPEGAILDALMRLRDAGIPARFGRWLVPGRPNTILIDYRSRFWSLDNDKYLMWVDHGIQLPPDDGELNEVIAFGFAVTEFFTHLAAVKGNRAVIAHFHEWMAGVAVPRIAHLKTPVQTVFTTHATLLGRYLASDSPDFYNHLPFINPDEMAAKYNIYARFAIERAATHASTVFTTVSEVTAREAEKLLGRKYDVILPNGLNIQRFSAVHEFQNLHRQSKERIHEFVMGHFFPAYTFDLDRTIYFVTSGRYEYRNKGMDMFIEALWRLNERMRSIENPRTVVAFIITRAATRNMNVGVLHSNSVFHDLKLNCEELSKVMGERLYKMAAKGNMPTLKDLLDEDTVVRLKKSIHTWRTGRQPPIVTHDMMYDSDDPVLRHLRHRHLFNSPNDPVKVVFHPDFVSPSNPLFGMDYEQFVRGCHLGVFPSYYEPWGYTPMECAALGVPAVTSDLSGFGAYVQAHIANHEEEGIKVVNRQTKSFDDSVSELADHLFEFVCKNRRQRIEVRNRVERLSEKFDWSVLAQSYADAHNLALERGGHPLVPGKFEVRMI